MHSYSFGNFILDLIPMSLFWGFVGLFFPTFALVCWAPLFALNIILWSLAQDWNIQSFHKKPDLVGLPRPWKDV